MIIFINNSYNMSTKFCQITLHIKRFIHERKVIPFFLPHSAERLCFRMIRVTRLTSPPNVTSDYRCWNCRDDPLSQFIKAGGVPSSTTVNTNKNTRVHKTGQ